MGVLTQRHGGTETQSGYGCLRQCWEGRRLASRATTAAPFGVRRPQDTKAAFAAHELSRNGDSSGYSCWFVSGVRPAFVSGGHVEPVRARRMRRGGRDEVSRPHATRTPQIAAGDSTCPAGVRGRAKRQHHFAYNRSWGLRGAKRAGVVTKALLPTIGVKSRRREVLTQRHGGTETQSGIKLPSAGGG